MIARFHETTPTVKSISSSESRKIPDFQPKLPFYPSLGNLDFSRSHKGLFGLETTFLVQLSSVAVLAEASLTGETPASSANNSMLGLFSRMTSLSLTVGFEEAIEVDMAGVSKGAWREENEESVRDR